MTTVTQKNGRNFFSLFRRGQQIEVKEITGYSVGDLPADTPVIIAPGATVLGNVLAPEVTVAGLLCGSIVTRRLTIQATGQVWGDVFASSVQMEAGGKIQGWMSHLDEPSYQTWQTNGTLPLSKPQPDEFPIPDDLVEKSLPIRNAAQLTALQHLQIQTATSLAARVELERAFEQRLYEVVGDTTAKLESLLTTLHEAEQSLDNYKRETADLRQRLQSRESQVEQQTNELGMAHELLTKQKEELGQLSQLSEQQTQQIEQLQTAKTNLETRLRETIDQLEAANGRLRSLEVALQTSLQHSADQEQSLLRWQELAEVTETRARKLENELSAAQSQTQQSADMIAMLRDQRNQLEKEWEKTLAELDTLRQKETRPLRAEDLTEYTDRIYKLETELAQLNQTHQEAQDQLIWYRANLETSQLELEQTHKLVATHTATIEQLQGDVTTKQALVEQWQAEGQNLAAKLTEQEQQWKKLRTNAEEMRRQAASEITALRDSLRQSRQQLEALKQEKEQGQKKLQTQLEQTRQQTAAEKKGLQDSLRQTRLQLEASEMEIDYHLKQVETQGKHLADIQATLIEREIQLKQVQKAALEQRDLIKKIQQVTNGRIQALETELKRAKELLKGRQQSG